MRASLPADHDLRHLNVGSSRQHTSQFDSRNCVHCIVFRCVFHRFFVARIRGGWHCCSTFNYMTLCTHTCVASLRCVYRYHNIVPLMRLCVRMTHSLCQSVSNVRTKQYITHFRLVYYQSSGQSLSRFNSTLSASV